MLNKKNNLNIEVDAAVINKDQACYDGRKSQDSTYPMTTPIYRPGTLQAFLEQLGIGPKKGLSQNFLIDGNIVRKIVSLSGFERGSWMFEIGPGPGALTEEMLLQGAHVIAAEKDAVLAQQLRRFQTADHRLDVVHHDVLTYPWKEYFAQKIGIHAKVHAIGNLPYHITTPILELLFEMHEQVLSITIMVQTEVAERMMAKPGTSAYGSLSLFTQFHCAIGHHFHVGPRSFYPVPRVGSTVVHLVPRAPLLAAEEKDLFFQCTRAAFNHRRKMLRSSLRDLYAPDLVEQALTTVGAPPTARPEMLGVHEFIAFFRHCSRG